MLFETANQGINFVIVFAAAFLLSFLLEFVHIYYIRIKKKGVVFCFDLMLTLGACMFFYLLCLALNYGEIRLYLAATYVLGLICASVFFGKIKKLSIKRKFANLFKREKKM